MHLSPGHHAARVARFAICYLVSSMVLTVVLFDVLGDGHADVPFTAFPSDLVLAPLVPAIPCVMLFTDSWPHGAVGLTVFGATFLTLWILHGQHAQRRRQRATR